MRLSFPIIAISLLAGSVACADHHDESSADGTKSLFNGKDLSGWTESKDNPGSFLVEDGILVARGGKGHLFYTGDVGDGDFTNFELHAKVRTTPGSNSGVYFHTQYQELDWPSQGYEAQVNSTASDPRKTGSLYGVADIYVPLESDEDFIVRNQGDNIQVAQPTAPSTDGEWFDYVIRVEGKKITIKVDGETTVVWTEPEDWEMEGRRLGHGTFALQAHDPDSEIHYKDIRVKILD